MSLDHHHHQLDVNVPVPPGPEDAQIGHTFDFEGMTFTAPNQGPTAWAEYDVFLAKLSR
jgi:hypothetical protein